MRIRKALPSTLMAATLCLVNCECFSVPHVFWPKHDVAATQAGENQAAGTVLIAARKSVFKEAVVKGVVDSLVADSLRVDIVGLDSTRNMDSTTLVSYDAIVLLNTCMSWNMDRRVNGLLKRLPDHAPFVILTTSGDSCWMPSERRRDFDAVCSASEDVKIQPVVDEIVGKVREKLRG